ncbi:adhesion G-protein coupled receptor F3 [Hyaena hyaena]|uniref:adhesion G-protein coupled receptor F3 n=1 Tax=Hyaena hyaena TaxID=95912 RepID=UPI001922206B|nr:adhesion G-protein coupled receptor F3 [Hyaena hyaena]
MPGNTLNLTLVTSHETTNLNWFLRPAGSPRPILLQPGTHVSLTSSPGLAVLSILNISHKWAGEYMCCFEAQGFRWELYQVAKVPLQETDVARLPDQLSVSCTTSPGFRLSCCLPSTHLVYTASWSPAEGSKASLVNTPDSQCFVLAVRRCPVADTMYTCELRSPGLSPLRVPVSVTIIRDGDTTCPKDSSAVAWNVTKAGHVAQAPCPMNRTGVVKRTCGFDGSWEPIRSGCTDTELLALSHRAWLLWAGQGRPAVEVPQILAELSQQALAVSSPSDLLALLGTISFLAKVVVDARIQLNRSSLEAFLKTTDKVLDMDTSSLWTPAQAQKPSTGSDLLLAVETLARSLCPEDHPFSFSLQNVQLQTQLLGPTVPADYRVSFSTQPPLQAHIPRCSLAPLGHNGTNVSITSLVLRKLDRLLPANYGQRLGDSLYATPGLVLAISIMAGGQAFDRGEVIMDFGDTEHGSGKPHLGAAESGGLGGLHPGPAGVPRCVQAGVESCGTEQSRLLTPHGPAQRGALPFGRRHLLPGSAPASSGAPKPPLPGRCLPLSFPLPGHLFLDAGSGPDVGSPAAVRLPSAVQVQSTLPDGGPRLRVPNGVCRRRPGPLPTPRAISGGGGMLVKWEGRGALHLRGAGAGHRGREWAGAHRGHPQAPETFAVRGAPGGEAPSPPGGDQSSARPHTRLWPHLGAGPGHPAGGGLHRSSLSLHDSQQHPGCLHLTLWLPHGQEGARGFTQTRLPLPIPQLHHLPGDIRNLHPRTQQRRKGRPQVRSKPSWEQCGGKWSVTTDFLAKKAPLHITNGPSPKAGKQTSPAQTFLDGLGKMEDSEQA